MWRVRSLNLLTDGYLKNTSSMDGAGIDEVHVLISQTVFMRTIMKTVLCENTEWMLSKEAFSIYASCMYYPTYEKYKERMEDYSKEKRRPSERFFR